MHKNKALALFQQFNGVSTNGRKIHTFRTAKFYNSN
jgi:hypothetical protein